MKTIQDLEKRIVDIKMTRERAKDLAYFILILVLFLILELAFATALYSGETQTLDLSSKFNEITSYSIQGNTSAIDINLTSQIAKITIPTDYEAGNFTITFYGYTEERHPTEVIYQGGGGQGGCSPSKIIQITNQTQAIQNQTCQVNNSTGFPIKQIIVDKTPVALVSIGLIGLGTILIIWLIIKFRKAPKTKKYINPDNLVN